MSKKPDTLVVGGGLFGQVIALQLKKQGRNVIVYDDGRPMNGTAPSGMLMKPSWFAGLGKSVHEPATKLLGDLYRLQELRFTVGISKLGIKRTHPVLYVDADEILGGVRVKACKVVGILDNRDHIIVRREKGVPQQFDLVIVAAGVWCNEISGILVPNLVGKQGISFLWDVGDKDYENFVEPWAPYKQIVGFKRNAHQVWVGDGSALLVDNWPIGRAEQCLRRCSARAKLPMKRTTAAIMGIRPYARGAKPCYLKRLSKRLWIATGGAKNGGIAAGWAAHKIGEATK